MNRKNPWVAAVMAIIPFGYFYFGLWYGLCFILWQGIAGIILMPLFIYFPPPEWISYVSMTFYLIIIAYQFYWHAKFLNSLPNPNGENENEEANFTFLGAMLLNNDTFSLIMQWAAILICLLYGINRIIYGTIFRGILLILSSFFLWFIATWITSLIRNLLGVLIIIFTKKQEAAK